MAEHLDILMFLVAIGVLLSGYPVAFSLAGVGVGFAIIGTAMGVFPPNLLNAIPSRIFGTMTNQVLIAVPLFVFMGVMLEKSRVAEELLDAMARLCGSLRGGLGIAVVLVGALLAASTGIVGATVVTMGLLSLPTMLRRGYAPSLASGSIAAAGTLGQIIPPSIVLILLGDVISNAYQRAQRDLGNFAPEPVSVGDLFAGSLVPGLLLVCAYIGYQVFIAMTKPEASPAVPEGERGSVSLKEIAAAVAPPIILIIAVLGSILAGIATPTRAAAIGAVGATFLAGLKRGGYDGPARRTFLLTALGAGATLALITLNAFADLRLGREEATVLESASALVGVGLAALIGVGLLAALHRLWGGRLIHDVSRQTAEITSMVFIILLGATVFSLVFRGLGGDHLVEGLIASASGGLLSGLALIAGPGVFELTSAQAAAGLVVVMAIMFLLGFFLDFIEITFVVVPLVAPPLLALGVDPIWLGVLMALNLQTSFLTPPFGFALFYLRGVAPPEVRTIEIYRGALPFVAIQLAALAAVATFPILATGLPALFKG